VLVSMVVASKYVSKKGKRHVKEQISQDAKESSLTAGVIECCSKNVRRLNDPDLGLF